MTFHPLALIFPALSGEAFAALAADIKANGLHEPITVTDSGQILDGRNRYLACVAVGVEPRYETWDGVGSPLAFVLSRNLHRRHLDESQRAMVAARVANLPHGGDRTKPPIGDLLPVTQDTAAKMLNVGERSVQRARDVLDTATPEMIAAVEQGHVSVSLAARYASQPPETQRDIVAKVIEQDMKPMEAARQVTAETIEARRIAQPTGRYRVIYADPPWQYGNSMPPGSMDARDHYPTMPLADICALPIRHLAEDDAVLFLWTTSPCLADALQVIAAWGFAYKASFVWDKMRPNLGHYNGVRHEFLLVGTRGSCQPDARTLVDSVIVEERTAHSVKPAVFRDIIDALYPHGARVELFARGRAPGCTVGIVGTGGA